MVEGKSITAVQPDGGSAGLCGPETTHVQRTGESHRCVRFFLRIVMQASSGETTNLGSVVESLK
jgi:hypothetical protein